MARFRLSPGDTQMNKTSSYPFALTEDAEGNALTGLLYERCTFRIQGYRNRGAGKKRDLPGQLFSLAFQDVTSRDDLAGPSRQEQNMSQSKGA